MRRLLATVALAAMLAAGAAAPSAPAVAAAPALPQAASCSGVWVVVDFGSLGGISSRCATSYGTGMAALRSAGFSPSVSEGFVDSTTQAAGNHFQVSTDGATFDADVGQSARGDNVSARTNLHGPSTHILQGGRVATGATANAVAMGYYFGGAAVLEWARSGADLKGFVSFHGGLETPDGQDYRAVKGDLLIVHGTADASVSMAQFAALAETLEQQGRRHEMITYSGAPHAFTVAAWMTGVASRMRWALCT